MSSFTLSPSKLVISIDGLSDDVSFSVVVVFVVVLLDAVLDVVADIVVVFVVDGEAVGGFSDVLTISIFSLVVSFTMVIVVVVVVDVVDGWAVVVSVVPGPCDIVC